MSANPHQAEMFGRIQPKPVRVIPQQKQSITERFWRFDRENPHVYRRIVQLARKAKLRGLEHYSIDGIFHVMRWEIAIRTRSRDQFRLNDHFTSMYARLVEDREFDLKGFFEIRRRRSK
jgi:hypothetical protein